MKTKIALTIFLAAGVIAYAQSDAIVGTWLTPDKDAKIEIFKQQQRYFGKMVWLTPDKDEKGRPFTDTENPDPALRTRPLVGLVIINDLVFANDKWKGKIYDPDSGKTYQAQIEMPDRNTLDLRGYIGSPIFGRTETWTRT